MRWRQRNRRQSPSDCHKDRGRWVPKYRMIWYMHLANEWNQFWGYRCQKKMWNEQCKVMEFRGGFHMTARVRETECQVYRDRQKYIVPAVSKAVYHWTSSKLDACVACDKLEHNKNNQRFSSVILVIKSVEGCQMSAVWPRDLSSQYYDCGSYPAFGQQNFFDHHNIRILAGADLLSLLDERDFSSPNANPGSSKIIILWLR